MSRDLKIGTLIRLADQADPSVLAPYRAAVGTVHPPAANDQIDLSRFNAAKGWGAIPHRQWLLGTAALRGHYSMLVAKGGSGKTAVAILLAVAAATGRSDIAGMHVHSQLRVLFITGEDSADEMRRRIWAVCKHHGIDPSDLGDRLCILPARDVGGITLNSVASGGFGCVSEDGFRRLESLLRQHRADILILDPLVSFCPGGLNDNSVASAVMGQLSDLAVQANCAMVLVHHVGKASVREGAEASAMAGLGAVSITSHARAVFAIMNPTSEEAGKNGIMPEEAWRHVYLANAKTNLTPPQDAIWYKLHSVELPNSDPANGYPDGDKVQAAAPFTPGTPASLYQHAALRAALAVLAVGSSAGPFSPSGQSGPRNYRSAVATGLEPFFPNATKPQLVSHAKNVFDVLSGMPGWVQIADVKLPRTTTGSKGGGTIKKGVLVGWDRTPWAADQPPGPHVAIAGATGGNTP